MPAAPKRANSECEAVSEPRVSCREARQGRRLAGEHRREHGNNEYDGRDRNRDGRRKRKLGKRQVDQRDGGDEHDGVEEDGGSAPVQRRLRDLFDLAPRPLGEKQRPTEADEHERQHNREERRVGDAGQHDGRRCQDVKVGPEGCEGEGASGPLQGLQALFRCGAARDHIYEDECPHIEDGPKDMTEDPGRRLDAHPPAGQRRHQGPDLDLVAGSLDGVPRDAEDEQHSHDPEVCRHAL